jgi:hypothetical protein
MTTEIKVTLDKLAELDGGGARLAVQGALIATATDEDITVWRDLKRTVAASSPAAIDRVRFTGDGKLLLAAPYAFARLRSAPTARGQWSQPTTRSWCSRSSSIRPRCSASLGVTGTARSSIARIRNYVTTMASGPELPSHDHAAIRWSGTSPPPVTAPRSNRWFADRCVIFQGGYFGLSSRFSEWIRANFEVRAPLD